MNSPSLCLAASLLLLCAATTVAQTTQTSPLDFSADKQAIIALENEWLHTKNAARLERILAPDFVHVIPAAIF